MWLTVLLAMFRYIVVCHHTLGPRLCSLQRTKIAIAAVFCVTTVCCSMHYVIYRPTVYNAGTVDDVASNSTHERNSTFDSEAYWIGDSFDSPTYKVRFVNR